MAATLAAALPAMAEDSVVTAALHQRASQVAGWVRPAPAGFADALSPSFLTAVPESAVAEIFRQLHEQVGACQAADLHGAADKLAHAAVFRMRCASGSVVEFELQVEVAPPHRISGLRLRPQQPATTSADLATALRAFEAFGPEAGVLVAELRDGVPLIRATHNAEAPLHIASIVKLCTLSAVLGAVADGVWHWDTVLRLEDGDRSLPSGALGSWPAETPLTLQTLVVLLLTDSDNTANDLLLRALTERGRWPAVPEPTLDAVGGVPILRTRQYFALRALPGHAQAWAAGETAIRKKLLRELPGWSLETLAQQFAAHGASTRATAGWTASPRALLPLLKRLAGQLEADSAAPARAVFTTLARRDPMLKNFVSATVKGGADYGVLALALLLHPSKDSPPVAVVAVWNGSTAAPPPGWQQAVQLLLGVLQRPLL